MVGHDERRLAERMHGSAQPSHRCIRIQQELCRYPADGQNDFRLDQGDLPVEVAPAGGRLVGVGVPIVWRPALEDVGNEGAVSALVYGAQHLIQQLAGPAHKRFATPVFLGARRLANDQPVGIRITDTEDGLGSAFTERTARAAGDGCAQRFPVQGLLRIGNRNIRRLRIGLITGQPDINIHRVEVGASLMFGLNHRLILHLPMCQFADQVRAGEQQIARFDEDFCLDRQVDFRDACQPEIRAALALADALPEADKRLRRQAEPVSAKLQHHVIALVGPDPESVGAVFPDSLGCHGPQVLDLTLDRRSSCIGSQAVDAYVDTMRLTLQDTLIGAVDLHHAAIDGTDDPKW